MRNGKEREIKGIYAAVLMVFLVFLLIPILLLLGKSFEGSSGFTLARYGEILTGKDFPGVLGRSIWIASISGVVTTILAFFLAYTIHYTNLPGIWKKVIRLAAVAPMLLPTITYGFAIIYSFGKQGLLTRILGFQLFDIYGFWGLLLGTLAASFVQCFFLCFTDYGIPASVGGQYEVVATVLYNEMLGSVPDFNRGAVVAMMMMVPSVLSITLLHYLEKYNIRYSRVSQVELKKNPVRDVCCGAVSFGILLCVLSSFAVIVIVPAVEEWPYQLSFTWKHVSAVLGDSSLLTVYKNSLLTAGLTALVGSLVVYGAALVTARSCFGERKKAVIESIALVTNTIPGMVIGIAFLFAFSGTPLQNTFFLIVICNVVHFFSTPYLIRREAMPFIRER